MNKLKQQLSTYQSVFPEEGHFKDQMLSLLQEKAANAFLRSSEDAHFTASAWLIDLEMQKVLLVEHTKIKKWLQPGGHADGELDLEEVAKKEVKEETNLRKLQLVADGIFDIDIHLIPALNTIKQHYHYDVRYAFFVDDARATRINKESKAFKWLSLPELEAFISNDSILRMAKKTEKIFNLYGS